ncbi:MAG: hypothetical protein MRK02_08685 [Candidatus Scalindua sp.]|nr:hypothetical protein [Candidatus Scalindua sp.]
MTVETEPEGNRFDHTFDGNGKFTDVYDQEGGHWNYTRTTDADGNILVTKETGEGNTTSYLDNTDSTGAYTSIMTDPTGAQTQFSMSSNGLTCNEQRIKSVLHIFT